MKDRVLRRPVCGFSMAQKRGRRLPMISSVRSTSWSPAARSRGSRLRAREYSVHTGLAHTMSKLPSERSSSITSQRTVGRNLGSRSTLTTSQPPASKALPIEPVPLKSSRSLGILFARIAQEPHKGDETRKEAGQLEVAEGALAQRHGWRWAPRVLDERVLHFFYHTRTDKRSERVALELPT